MKKIRLLLLCVLVSALPIVLSSCASSQYRDGVYLSQVADFSSSGWKDFVEVTIEDGEVVKINWDSIYKDDSIPIRKKQYSKSGLYGMLATGAVGEWYDQAIAAEQYVLENGINKLEVGADGYTDAVTGCTIHVSDFERMFRDCLEQAGE